MRVPCPRAFLARRGSRLALAAFVLVGCSRAPLPALPAEVPTTSTAMGSTLDASSAGSRPPGASSADASAPVVETSRCQIGGVAGALSLREIARGCLVEPLPVTSWDVSGGVEVSVALAEATVASGESLAVVVTYKNKTAKPLDLTFEVSRRDGFPPPPWMGDVTAHEASGRMVDMSEEPRPPWAAALADEPRQFAVLTLAGGAVLEDHLHWAAARYRWAASGREKQYPRSLLGPLGKGVYALKVHTTLVLRAQGGRLEYATPTATVRVQ